MKRFYFVVWILCFALLLAACAPGSDSISCPAEPADDGASEPNTAMPAGEDDIEEQIPLPMEELELRIVDGAETGELVLAGDGPKEVYTLTVGDTPVYLDGEPADASVLEDGMLVTLGVYKTAPSDGSLTVPNHISVDSLGTEDNPGGGYYDLCGFYLQVLEDLWNADPGLNDGISYISVDLTQAPGDLTAGEKAAIVQIFAGAHNAEGLNLTRAQLADQGYLTDGAWEDGVLFAIEPHAAGQEEAYSLPVLRFDASKWRGPLGAYYFTDCTAVWPELGTWDGYTVGGEAIS